MSDDNRRQYRNLLINPRYQIRFVLWAAASCLVIIFYFAAIIYTALRQYHANVIMALSPDLQSQVQADYQEIVTRLLMGSGVIFIAALGVGLLLSHKTAGPLYSLKRTMDRVRGGDYTARAKFRPGDDLGDIAESFNAMMDELQKRT